MEFIFYLLSLAYFVVAVVLAFYVPGRVVLGRVSFPLLVKIAISIVIGIVLWAYAGILFGYLHARFLSYVYLLVFLALFFYKKHFTFPTKIKFTPDFPSMLLIVIGVCGQVLPYIRMGWVTSQGVIIAAHNQGDHIWNASLVHELISRFPPNEPSLAGIKLLDYHYLYNLVAADLISVFHLPFFPTQFIGLYALAPILLGVIAYYLSNALFPSKTFTRLFLFFLYFSGDAAGWVMLMLRHAFIWNLSSLINDASKFMDSPQYGYAIVIGLTGFYLLIQHKNTLPKKIAIICALLFGCLLEFKVYVGIPFLFALGGYALGGLLKRHVMPGMSFLIAGTIAFLLLKSGSSTSAGLVYLPVDIPRDFINQPLLQLTDWQLRWVIFQTHHNIPRLIQYGFYMSGLYLLIQFGVQLCGVIPFPATLKKLRVEEVLFLYGGIISAFILGLFFYQTVGGANIWEFFLAASPFLSLLVALGLTLVLQKIPRVAKAFVIVLLVIIVIPQWVISQTTYVKEEYFSTFHGISTDEEASYMYLSAIPNTSTIFPVNQQPYSYASVVNLFVNKPLFISGIGVRQILTPELAKREKEEVVLTNSTNSQDIASILQTERVTYVYYYNPVKNESALLHAGLHVVFTNKTATIFQAN